MATALPAASDWTGASQTEGDFKAAQNDLRAYLAGLMGEDGEVFTALTTLGASFSGYRAISTSTTLTTADRGKLVNATSSTFTVTLPAAATAGAGFMVCLINSGTGVFTIDGYLTETIDGATTLELKQYGTGMVVCDGSKWFSFGAYHATQSAGDNTGRIATTAYADAASDAASPGPGDIGGTELSTTLGGSFSASVTVGVPWTPTAGWYVAATTSTAIRLYVDATNYGVFTSGAFIADGLNITFATTGTIQYMQVRKLA